MKNNKILLALTALIALASVSCKTTEKNYRTAYEKAVAGTGREVTEFDQTIYGRHRRAIRDVPMVVGNDTIPTKLIRVAVTPDGGGVNEWLQQYSVVAGGFKQLFNAKSMRDRLAEAGLPRVFLVQTAEPYYYVVTASSDNLKNIQIAADSLRVTSPIPLKDDCPFILQRPWP